MFRKLSVAALLVLASGAQAQKRVTNVAFCAFPTLEGSDCAISGDVAGGTLGQLTCGGSVIGDGTEEFLRPATLNSLVGDHLSQLRSGACGSSGSSRIGVWEASCLADVYEPIVVRLEDELDAPDAAKDLQDLCKGATVPTPTAAGTSGAMCSAQLSVTENAVNKGVSKLGSTAWYNYAPVPTYNLVGGYQNQDFGLGAGNGVLTEVYCVFWPSYSAVLGKSGGGTNKLAKPIIKDVSTSAAFGPGGGFFALPADADEATETTTKLFFPTYTETISVNYHKNGPPASGL